MNEVLQEADRLESQGNPLGRLFRWHRLWVPLAPSHAPWHQYCEEEDGGCSSWTDGGGCGDSTSPQCALGDGSGDGDPEFKSYDPFDARGNGGTSNTLDTLI